MIDYKYLNRTGLQEFIHSKEFETMPHLPISHHRALSHLNNPRLESSDVLLIMAFEKGDMLGYLGIIPDYFFKNDGTKHKYGCLSCLWITPAGRGKGLGSILLKKGVESWNGRALLSDYVPQTYKIYQKAGVFAVPIHKEGLRLYVRMDTGRLLPPKSSIFERIKPLLSAGDWITNTLLDSRFLFYKNPLEKYKIEFVDQVNEELTGFIEPFLKEQLIRRGQAELNWMLEYPWVLSSKKEDENSRRYYFSSVDRLFKYRCLVLRNEDGQIAAFLMFLRRNNDLQLPYAYFNKENIHDVVQIINGLIVKWKMNTFTTFTPELVDYMSTTKVVGLYKKRVVRNYILSKNLTADLSGQDINIMDGDADDGFT